MRQSQILVPLAFLAIAAAVAFADPSENPAAAPGATTTEPTSPYGTDSRATVPTDQNRPTDRTRSSQSSTRRRSSKPKYTPPSNSDSSSPGNPATVNPPPVGAPAGTTGVPSGAAAH